MSCACGAGRGFRPSLLLAFPLLSPAFRAYSDDSQQVLRHFKPVPRSHGVLDRLEFGGKEFDDLSATRTDHMVMVLMFVLMLVMRAAVTEPDFSGEAGI